MLRVAPIGRALHTSARIAAKATPSKAHLHQPIADESFPHGFVVTGVHSGIKKSATAHDLALIASTTARTSAAACFTRNVFKAAPVQVSNSVLKSTSGRANKIVVSSGCANAVTGSKGLQDAWAMARATDEAFGDATSQESSSTLVMSTGVIGQLLPISNILNGIKSAAVPLTNPSLSPSFSSWEAAAKAFMTTDTFPKLRARSFQIPSTFGDGKLTTVRFAGIDKGAGMIHPNMGPPHATLLGLIVTDAPVSPSSLQSALTHAVNRSFNSISVDGDMSTNDTIIALANGAALPFGAEEIDEHKHPEAFAAFRDQLTAFAIELAQLVVRDGEGATKFVTVTVKGARTYEDAHRIASSISTSSLVKCALYGEDANWGRILCAVGYAPLSTTTPSSPDSTVTPMVIDPTTVSVSFVPSDGSAPLALLVNGEPEAVDEARASEIVGVEDVGILVDLGGQDGDATATYWTCDLSHEYVTINGDYRS